VEKREMRSFFLSKNCHLPFVHPFFSVRLTLHLLLCLVDTVTFVQDPEMMAEAAKMMNDPAFKKNMEKLQSSKEFKDSVKKTKDVLSDPNQAAHLEAKMEHMQKVGNDQLKKRAGDAMEQAMASLSDPAVMAEMTKMLKDPKFQKDLENMTKDPQFQSYMEAMQDMMSDPRKKAKLEAAADAVRSSL
jgi:tyrosyl-tRNA synthetase